MKMLQNAQSCEQDAQEAVELAAKLEASMAQIEDLKSNLEKLQAEGKLEVRHQRKRKAGGALEKEPHVPATDSLPLTQPAAGVDAGSDEEDATLPMFAASQDDRANSEDPTQLLDEQPEGANSEDATLLEDVQKDSVLFTDNKCGDRSTVPLSHLGKIQKAKAGFETVITVIKRARETYTADCNTMTPHELEDKYGKYISWMRICGHTNLKCSKKELSALLPAWEDVQKVKSAETLSPKLSQLFDWMQANEVPWKVQWGWSEKDKCYIVDYDDQKELTGSLSIPCTIQVITMMQPEDNQRKSKKRQHQRTQPTQSRKREKK